MFDLNTTLLVVFVTFHMPPDTNYNDSQLVYVQLAGGLMIFLSFNQQLIRTDKKKKTERKIKEYKWVCKIFTY